MSWESNKPRPACLWCDNLGATYLTANLIFYARMNHVDVDYHLVHERVANKLLDVRFVSTGDQDADDFTKALSLKKLKYFRHNLNLLGS
jgi:hypothetical protein